MWNWEACADYADGTSICKLFPYDEHDSYKEESERQYELEAWLLSRQEGCTWYSVNLMKEE